MRSSLDPLRSLRLWASVPSQPLIMKALSYPRASIVIIPNKMFSILIWNYPDHPGLCFLAYWVGVVKRAARAATWVLRDSSSSRW